MGRIGDLRSGKAKFTGSQGEPELTPESAHRQQADDSHTHQAPPGADEEGEIRYNWQPGRYKRSS